MTKFLTSLIQGLAIGTAEIIPGVSGSTIALLLGIYDDFIDLLYQGSELVRIGALWLARRKKFSDVIQAFNSIRWGFGIFLGLGMMIAVVGLSSIITVILTQYPAYLFAFLLGLTPPTMYVVFTQLEKPGLKEGLTTTVTAVVFLSIFVFGGQVSSVTQPHPVHLFLGGVIAVSTMVLPGVSGSFMLLVLGLYGFVVGLIAELSTGVITSQAVTSVLILMSGMAVGFLTTVRLLKAAFNSFRNQLMSFLLGLLTASWYVLWPFVVIAGFDHGEPILEKVSPFSLPVGASILITAIVIGTTIITWFLHTWADTRDPQSPAKDSGFDRV